MIAIIDYGMGNLHSVQKALQSLGGQTQLVSRPEDLKQCQKIVLPGVGGFADAVRVLRQNGMATALKEAIGQGKPFLGICLGLQLLFEKSQEAANAEGLGLLKGEVKKFALGPQLKVPHIGWNQLKLARSASAEGRQGRQVTNDCPLLKDIPDGSYVYFCHSYYPQPQDASVVAATCDYGIDFACLIWQENIFGAQFHPEKSQEIGMRLLKNFVAL